MLCTVRDAAKLICEKLECVNDVRCGRLLADADAMRRELDDKEDDIEVFA
jgi:hypothetical protein